MDLASDVKTGSSNSSSADPPLKPLSSRGAGSKRKRSVAESSVSRKQQEAIRELEGLCGNVVCTELWKLPAGCARSQRTRQKTRRLSPHEDSCEKGAVATAYNEITETRGVTDDDLVISHG